MHGFTTQGKSSTQTERRISVQFFPSRETHRLGTWTLFLQRMVAHRLWTTKKATPQKKITIMKAHEKSRRGGQLGPF